MNKQSAFKKITISLSQLWLCLLALLPLTLVVIISFMKSDDTHLVLWQPTLSNYTQLIDPLFLHIFLQSFQLAGITTLLCLILGYPMALIIAFSKPRYRPILLLLIIIPFWTSSLIRTYALFTLLKTKGLINALLISLGIIHQPLQLLYSNTAVLIGTTYNLLPFMILPIYSVIEKLDKELINAAKDLGASPIVIFTRILLPLSMPGIIAGSLLVILPAMTLFYIPDLLGGAKSILLGNLIQVQFLNLNNWPAGSATSVTLTAFMLLLVAIQQIISKRKKTGIIK